MPDLFAALLAIFVIGGMVGRLIWVLRQNPPSDIAHIKANYEGLQGKAGPNMVVISTTRSGFYLGSRSEPPYRKYNVLLRGLDGLEKRRVVGVSVGILDSGDLREFNTTGTMLRSRTAPWT